MNVKQINKTITNRKDKLTTAYISPSTIPFFHRPHVHIHR